MNDDFWCLVSDGAVTLGPRALPRSLGNISNFYALPETDLHALGWRKYRLVVTAQPGQVVVGEAWEITDTEVVETQIVRDLTPEEAAAAGGTMP